MIMRFEALNDFSLVSGIGIRVVGTTGEECFATSQYEKSRAALDYIAEHLNAQDECTAAVLQSCVHSERFGGHYVSLCPRGLTFFTSPIIREGRRRRYAIGGPVIMSSLDDYIDFEFLAAAPSADPEEARELLRDIPVVDPSLVSALSVQLFINVMAISGDFSAAAALNNSDSNESYAYDLETFERGMYFHKPDQTEKDYALRPYMFGDKRLAVEHYKLLKTLSKHEEYQARVLMNEVLEQTLFHTNHNVELIKSRIPEFLLMMFRAAIRDGADAEMIAQIKDDVFHAIDDLNDLDEIVVWLNTMYEQFDSFILQNPQSKHGDVIRGSLAYIRDHYAEHITLNDVAQHVFLSPTYLSKLFKIETGQSFKSYLNRIRIERSKELMSDNSMSIAKISYSVGFEDQSYYTKVFRQYEGISPYQYRCFCEYATH
jgi:AraC-like DNA-binding protein/ligand-binding sensor protein